MCGKLNYYYYYYYYYVATDQLPSLPHDLLGCAITLLWEFSLAVHQQLIMGQAHFLRLWVRTSFMSTSLALPTASNLEINFKLFFSSTICPLLVFTFVLLSIVENVLSLVALIVANRSGSSLSNCFDIKVLHFCSPMSFAQFMSLETSAVATFTLAILNMLPYTSKDCSCLL